MSCCISRDVSLAARVLSDGGLVAFPTETVYGLGANMFDERAVARVFDVKGRPQFDPLIVHIADLTWLDQLVCELPELAGRLIHRFWPGPLTLVLPKTRDVPDLVTAGLPSVGIRMPDHPVALSLLKEANRPIAAPSANPFGQLSPTQVSHVADQLGDQIDLILDGGACRVGLESTVLQLTEAKPKVLRPGGITIEDLETLIGPVDLVNKKASPISTPQASPGLLSRHYAPRTPLVLVKDFSECPHDQRVGLLSWTPVVNSSAYDAVEVLSETGNLIEAATHFFGALRRLDQLGLDVIVARQFPAERIGVALNDRLRRAAQPKQCC